VVVIDDYEEVPENDEASLLKAVSKQPVSIAIEASSRDFQHYSGVSPTPLFTSVTNLLSKVGGLNL
jgi:hypothetical protein